MKCLEVTIHSVPFEHHIGNVQWVREHRNNESTHEHWLFLEKEKISKLETVEENWSSKDDANNDVPTTKSRQGLEVRMKFFRGSITQ